ncbi:MAG TPA: acyl-CoA dehydrogenase, partial [Thermoanaerobaculia bacterium]|nr:acyl-CoA dehydrogenase [Thermoanaerobaculia bacterium]
IAGLPVALAELEEGDDAREADSEILGDLRALARLLVHRLEREREMLHELEAAAGPQVQKSPELLDAAARYCAWHAAAACLHVWLLNRRTLDSFFARGEWLVLCLTRLLRAIPGSERALSPSYAAAALERLLRLSDENALFSLTPFPLAPRGQAPRRAESS